MKVNELGNQTEINEWHFKRIVFTIDKTNKILLLLVFYIKRDQKDILEKKTRILMQIPRVAFIRKQTTNNNTQKISNKWKSMQMHIVHDSGQKSNYFQVSIVHRTYTYQHLHKKKTVSKQNIRGIFHLNKNN